jgi:Glycosyl hydrolase family 79 C-terminal beta domain
LALHGADGGIHNRRASDDKAYTPIGRSCDRYHAKPLYYGMLMFAQAARGALVPAHLAPDTSGLKAFAVRAPEGTLRVCLINQNITRDERVAIDPVREFTVASVLRLEGPAIDATAGVTLGGASVDEFGRWGPPTHEQANLTGHEIVVDVPAASAALVSLRG